MKLHITIISLFFCNAIFPSEFSISDKFNRVKEIIASEKNVHLGPMITVHNSIIACNSYNKKAPHTNAITQYFYDFRHIRDLHRLTTPSSSLHNFIDRGNCDHTVVKTDQNGNFVIISFDKTSNKITTWMPDFTPYLGPELKISSLSCNKNNNNIAIGLNNGTIIKTNVEPTNCNFPNKRSFFLQSKSSITFLYYLTNNDLLFTQHRDLKLFDNAKQSVGNLWSMINPIISTALYKDTVACCDNENIAIISNIFCKKTKPFYISKIQSNITAIQLYKDQLFIVNETGDLNIYQICHNNIDNYLYLIKWATITHEGPLSSIIIDEQQQKIITSYTKKEDDDLTLSTIIASYPTLEALNNEFNKFFNNRIHIKNAYDACRVNQNTALTLYAILKNSQNFLLQHPYNILLINTIQLEIMNSLNKVVVSGNTPYEQIENYLTEIKNIGIDFTRTTYTPNPEELLYYFNLKLCWNIINIIYTSIEQKLTIEEQKQLLNKYPLLKNHPNYSQENYNHSY